MAAAGSSSLSSSFFLLSLSRLSLLPLLLHRLASGGATGSGTKPEDRVTPGRTAKLPGSRVTPGRTAKLPRSRVTPGRTAKLPRSRVTPGRTAKLPRSRVTPGRTAKLPRSRVAPQRSRSLVPGGLQGHTLGFRRGQGDRGRWFGGLERHMLREPSARLLRFLVSRPS